MARTRATQEEIAKLQELAERLEVKVGDIQELADLGFEWANTEKVTRLIVASSAREKCGKTHFSLETTPQPVALIDFDLGTEGVIDKFAHRKIIHKSFNARRLREVEGIKSTQAQLEDEWEEIKTTFLALVRSPIIRTVVVDTATEMWEAARLSEFGKLDQVKAHHYGPVNREFRNLIQAVYQNTKLNAIFLHKVKKEYVNDKSTGKYERAGFSDMPFLVQVNIEHFKEQTDDGPEFGIKIINCRQNADLDGEELSGPACSFSRLGMMAIPGSKKSDWE